MDAKYSDNLRGNKLPNAFICVCVGGGGEGWFLLLSI